MGFFDGQSAALFRQAPDGRKLFRPFGRRWGTYVVPPERAAHLVVWQRRYLMATFAIILVAVSLWHVQALWGLPVLVAPLYAKYWHFARGLPRTEEEPLPVNRKELFTTQASAIGTRVLFPVVIGSVLMFAGGVWMSVVQPGLESYLVAGFFGLATVVNGAQLWAARRRRR